MVMEVWLVDWLLLIMFGFKHRNSYLHLPIFYFETLKIIKMDIATFSIYQGICGLITTKKVSCYFLILLFLVYTSYHLYIAVYLFFTHFMYVTFSLLAVATISFSG